MSLENGLPTRGLSLSTILPPPASTVLPPTVEIPLDVATVALIALAFNLSNEAAKVSTASENVAAAFVSL